MRRFLGLTETVFRGWKELRRIMNKLLLMEYILPNVREREESCAKCPRATGQQNNQFNHSSESLPEF